MISPLLWRLSTDEFSDSIGFVLPPAPLRRVLQDSPDVQRLERALRYGQVTSQEISEFVEQILKEFRRGELFRHDIALAALAVAMEHWNNPFAEDFLIDLARTQRPEFRASFRIARESLKARYAFPKTQVKTARYPQGGAVRATSRIRVMYRVGHGKRNRLTPWWKRYPEASNAKA
jgi:hypothetical protein